MKCIFKESDATEIIPQLFLGNSKSSRSINFLKNYNIKCVIRILQYQNKNEFKIFNYFDNNIEYYDIPIKDSDICKFDLNNFFNIISKIINDNLSNKKSILVHCQNGHHRSASLVAAYLIKYHNLDFITSVKYINGLRKCALRRDTCMVKKLFKFYLKLKNINHKNINCSREFGKTYINCKNI